jgi:signal transduction histidine kinase
LKVTPNQEKFFENIFGDEKRYEQILLNFLSNALKFTPSEGKVDVVL